MGYATPTRALCEQAIRSVVSDEARAEVLGRAESACEECGGRSQVELHHLTYRPVASAAVMDNLFALCGPCHREVHGEIG